jgi:hypothetical protein
MAGTDELFPDAVRLPGAAVPPPPPPGAAASGYGSMAPRPQVRRRRGLGVAAFVLGLLAVVGDLIGIAVALFTVLNAVTHLGRTVTNIDDSLGSILGVVVLEFLVFFGGIVFAVIAVILGIIAVVNNRGRVLGIFGLIFGIGVLVAHLMLGMSIAGSGNVPGLTS